MLSLTETCAAPTGSFHPLLSHLPAGKMRISHVAKLLFASWRGSCPEVKVEEGQTVPNPLVSPLKALMPETFQQRP